AAPRAPAKPIKPAAATPSFEELADPAPAQPKAPTPAPAAPKPAAARPAPAAARTTSAPKATQDDSVSVAGVVIDAIAAAVAIAFAALLLKDVLPFLS
ncbi:MAG: hypothetical protein NWS00_05735, partial [Opitutales bacterium]|nr:hypothetical protein [Opitutales bacterium]